MMHNHGISGSVAANGRSSQAGSPLLVSVSPICTMRVNVYSTWSNYRNWAHCKLRNDLGATKRNASMRDQFSAGNEDIWEGSLCNWGPDHICQKALGRMVGTQVCAWSSGMTQGQLVQPSVFGFSAALTSSGVATFSGISSLSVPTSSPHQYTHFQHAPPSAASLVCRVHIYSERLALFLWSRAHSGSGLPAT